MRAGTYAYNTDKYPHANGVCQRQRQRQFALCYPILQPLFQHLTRYSKGRRRYPGGSTGR